MATQDSTTFEVQARQTRGEWETVCTDTIEAAAQATASYIARRYEVETRVVTGGAPSETRKAAKKAYDPGTPTQATKRPDGTFAIDSFRGEGLAYVVDPAVGTCSCPDHRKRARDCKHIKAVRSQLWTSYTEKAQQVADHALPVLIEKYESAGRLDIALAIRAEMLDRQQQAVGA